MMDAKNNSYVRSALIFVIFYIHRIRLSEKFYVILRYLVQLQLFQPDHLLDVNGEADNSASAFTLFSFSTYRQELAALFILHLSAGARRSFHSPLIGRSSPLFEQNFCSFLLYTIYLRKAIPNFNFLRFHKFAEGTVRFQEGALTGLPAIYPAVSWSCCGFHR